MNLLKMSVLVLAWGAAQLTSGGSISRTLRLPGGAPAAGVRVAAMVVPGVLMPTNEASIAESIAQTDGNGRYQLDNIPPGRYLIAAGLLNAPTYHPGTLAQNSASIVTVTQGSQTLAGIDFTLTGSAPGVVDGRVGLSGRLFNEDGSPLPRVSPRDGSVLPPTFVLNGAQNGLSGFSVSNQQGGGGITTVNEDGSFQLSLVVGSTGHFSVRLLPPGYSLKSVVYGGKNVGLAPVVIDKALFALDLIVGYEQISTPQPVTVRGKVVNIPGELKLTSVSLTSTTSGGPTVPAPIQPDGSFEFSSVPGGVYRTGGRDAAGHNYVSFAVVAIRNTISDLTIDLRNNPFLEFEGAPPKRYAFTGTNLIELKGVVTQKLTPIKRPDSEYFRIDVKDESTGAVTPWAVYVDHDWQAPRVVVGETLVVPGIASTDGTNRLTAVPF